MGLCPEAHLFSGQAAPTRRDSARTTSMQGGANCVFGRLTLATVCARCPLLGVENLVLRLQNARGVPNALETSLAYRPQGQDTLDVERIQLVGVPCSAPPFAINHIRNSRGNRTLTVG